MLCWAACSYVGDFNADPIVIPSLAKGVMDGHWIDLEQAFATGGGVAPSHTFQFQLLLLVVFCQIAGSFRIFLFMWSSLSLLGMPQLIGLEFILLCGLLVGLLVLIVLDVLRHMRFRISGTFMFKRSALFLRRFEKSSLLFVVHLM